MQTEDLDGDSISAHFQVLWGVGPSFPETLPLSRVPGGWGILLSGRGGRMARGVAMCVRGERKEAGVLNPPGYEIPRTLPDANLSCIFKRCQACHCQMLGSRHLLGPALHSFA